MSDPKIGELLAVVEQSDLVKDPLSVQAVNIREWRRSYDRVTKIPEDLAVEVIRKDSSGSRRDKLTIRPRNASTSPNPTATSCLFIMAPR